jgi:hypothetical protein
MSWAGDKEANAKQTKMDLEALKDFLPKNYPKKKWQTGPTRLDTPELRQAYEKRRFYFVFSALPLPPGANIKSVQEAYQRRVLEFRATFISLTVSLDGQGKMVSLQKPDDYNAGLMKVASDEDAKVAAAAILTLASSDRVSPGAVAAKDVVVKKNDKGWSCQASRKGAYHGSVTFDSDGKCTQVSKTYAGPFPP